MPEFQARSGEIAVSSRWSRWGCPYFVNAAEAMEGQTDARLTLAVARDGERVRLIFADNGPGVAPDVARQLFTPFVTTRANGLGLGLVICRDIVASFGGELDLVPAERGATFVAVLKAA